MPAENELAAAPTDVDHEPEFGVVLQTVRDAEINQPRLLAAGNDVDRMTQGSFGARHELVTVARLAQGVGADDSNAARFELAKPLAEALQGRDGARHGTFVEFIVAVESGSEPHHVAHLVDDTEFFVGRLGNDHVKTVGTQVDRGDSRRDVVYHRRPFSREWQRIIKAARVFNSKVASTILTDIRKATI